MALLHPNLTPHFIQILARRMDSYSNDFIFDVDVDRFNEGLRDGSEYAVVPWRTYDPKLKRRLLPKLITSCEVIEPTFTKGQEKFHVGMYLKAHSKEMYYITLCFEIADDALYVLSFIKNER